MKASRWAAEVGSASALLGLLGMLAGCSLETTGSGDFALGSDDDDDTSAAEDPQDGEADDPSKGVTLADDENQSDDSAEDASVPREDAATASKDAGPSVGNGTCRPGRYQGSFTCTQPTIAAPLWASSLGGNEITGSFTFRLEPTGKSNTFELTGGSLHSEDNAFFKLDANILASFECGRPLQGKLTEASYTTLFGVPTPFESPFDASYDEATDKFRDGTWVVKNDTTTQCNGSWSATRSSD